jgi:hypothetical protein
MGDLGMASNTSLLAPRTAAAHPTTDPASAVVRWVLS